MTSWIWPAALLVSIAASKLPGLCGRLIVFRNNHWDEVNRRLESAQRRIV